MSCRETQNRGTVAVILTTFMLPSLEVTLLFKRFLCTCSQLSLRKTGLKWPSCQKVFTAVSMPFLCSSKRIVIEEVGEAQLQCKITHIFRCLHHCDLILEDPWSKRLLLHDEECFREWIQEWRRWSQSPQMANHPPMVSNDSSWLILQDYRDLSSLVLLSSSFHCHVLWLFLFPFNACSGSFLFEVFLRKTTWETRAWERVMEKKCISCSHSKVKSDRSTKRCSEKLLFLSLMDSFSCLVLHLFLRFIVLLMFPDLFPLLFRHWIANGFL